MSAWRYEIQTGQSENCFCCRLPVPPVGVNRASEKEFSPVLSDQCQPLVTIMSDERYVGGCLYDAELEFSVCVCVVCADFGK